jgi:hypothetical protein
MIYVEKIGNWTVAVIMVTQVIVNIYTCARVVIFSKKSCGFGDLKSSQMSRPGSPCPKLMLNNYFLNFKWLCMFFLHVEF